MRVTASLVLYHNDPSHYAIAIKSFLDGCDGVIGVIDNSSVPLQHELFSHERVRYVFSGRNLGFGVAHNRALKMLGEHSDIHLFLNPDIEFTPDVIPVLTKVFDEYTEVGAVMPRIEFPGGELQALCKLLPTPLDLVFRRFIPVRSMREKINNRYELRDLKHDCQFDAPNLSGCFLLARMDVLRNIGGFDERYFMYMEDVDLVRRIGDCGRTVYEPSVSVTHAYGKGSYRNKKLLWYHMRSAISYFNKWGWFIDATRTKRNMRTLESLRTSNIRENDG